MLEVEPTGLRVVERPTKVAETATKPSTPEAFAIGDCTIDIFPLNSHRWGISFRRAIHFITRKLSSIETGRVTVGVRVKVWGLRIGG